MGLFVTGALNAILTVEHRREMIRYLYNHQVYVLLIKIHN